MHVAARLRREAAEFNKGMNLTICKRLKGRYLSVTVFINSQLAGYAQR